MPSDLLGLPGREPEIAILDRLAVVERGCLALTAATVLVSAFDDIFSVHLLSLTSGWLSISPEAAAVSGLSAVGVYFAKSRQQLARRMASSLVLLALLAAAASFAGGLTHLLAGPEPRFSILHGAWLALPDRMSPQCSVAFALLAATVLLLQARKRAAVWAADVLVSFLLLLVLILDSSSAVQSLHLFGRLTGAGIPLFTLVCLTLLTMVVLARQARRGIFAVFVGRGTGSKFARKLALFLILVPFVREVIRAHVIGSGRISPPYMSGVMSTLASVFSIAVLIYLATRYNAMEAEIQDLSLRDELTGLYNLRGFRLLAEQAHLLARRSMQPFSILYVDLDGLKRINDELGHRAGSELLVSVANLLKEAFRETDVLARIGGDEFAVAGVFSRSAVTEAAARLEEAAAGRNRNAASAMMLRFSVGHATSAVVRHESLEELLARADEAMYEEKRRRKAELKQNSSRKSGLARHAAPSGEPALPRSSGQD